MAEYLLVSQSGRKPVSPSEVLGVYRKVSEFVYEHLGSRWRLTWGAGTRYWLEHPLESVYWSGHGLTGSYKPKRGAEGRIEVVEHAAATVRMTLAGYNGDGDPCEDYEYKCPTDTPDLGDPCACCCVPDAAKVCPDDPCDCEKMENRPPEEGIDNECEQCDDYCKEGCDAYYDC